MTESNQWLPLYALACHATGDFILQTDEMAEKKFDDKAVRMKHVYFYASAFTPLGVLTDWNKWQRLTFIASLIVSHYLIDSQRWVESKDGFETYPVWYDQSMHIIALALCVWLAEVQE